MSRLREFLTKKIRNRYRLIIRNDQNLEERVSIVLTPLNVVLIVSSLMVLFATAIILLLPVTPLRSLLPGVDSVNSRNLYELQQRLDSLEDHLKIQEKRNEELLKIMSGEGEPSTMIHHQPKIQAAGFSGFFEAVQSQPDSRTKELKQERNDRVLKFSPKRTQYVFFTPLKGVITDTFNTRNGHTAVDVVSYSNAGVKATLDGTVILSSWTPETGHVLILQHQDNFISAYKHNSTLFKSQGDRVRAGEVIALVGNSGELTTGPHLHFELWHNGRAVNPVDYVSF